MYVLLKYVSRVGSLVVLFFLLAACSWPVDLALLSVDTEPPQGAWVDAPLHGAEAPPGFAIKVIGHVDPSVGQAVLYINGVNSGLPSAPILGKQPPAYQWEWIPEQPGLYHLRIGGAQGPLSTPVLVTISGDMAYRAEFWADQTSMKAGECTALHWKTENATQVQLDGVTVDPEGDQGFCIQQDEEHILHVQYKDMHTEDLSVKLLLLVDTPTPTSTSTSTPTSTPTATEYIPPPPVETEPPPPVITTEPPPPRDTQPPPAPSGLSPCGSQRAPVTLPACGVVDLTWSAVKDVSGIAQY